jgi:hypothetical protein
MFVEGYFEVQVMVLQTQMSLDLAASATDN